MTTQKEAALTDEQIDGTMEHLLIEEIVALEERVREQSSLSAELAHQTGLAVTRAEAAERALAGAHEALKIIALWYGQFPPAWDRDGTPSTYGLQYGSNGERDYMRSIALKALNSNGQTIDAALESDAPAPGIHG